MPNDRPPLGHLFAQLVHDGQAFVRAEARLYRAQALNKALEAGWAAGFALAAALVASSALTALLVGLIFALGPVLGRWWAVVIVIVGAFLVAGVLGWLAMREISLLTGRSEER